MRRMMLLVVAAWPAGSQGQDCVPLNEASGLFLDAYADIGDTAGVAAGDIDGDGSPDVVATLRFSARLVVFRRKGGAFPLADYVPLSLPAGSIRLADLDRDGDLDAAAATRRGVSLLWNEGAGALGNESDLVLGPGERMLRAGDLNGDGFEELLALNRSPERGGPTNIAVMGNERGGRFGAPRNYAAGESAGAFDLADLDGDGDTDAAVVESMPRVRILENDSLGGFPRSRTWSLPFPQAVSFGNDLVAGEFDGDGRADLCVAAGDHFGVLLGKSGGDFLAPPPLGMPAFFTQLVPGDFDGSGSLDAALVGGEHLLLNDGAGALSARWLRSGLWGSSGCAADLDRDGDPDLIVEGTGLSFFTNREATPESDCNRNGIPDRCEYHDCNQNGVLDECDVLSGVVEDCNGNAVPDECELDCDRNGSPDACDIAAGRAPDCNGNLVPDECEPPPADCNRNGSPDDCDIARGVSADCNRNGVPDDCDVEPGFGFRGQVSPSYGRMTLSLSSDLDGDGLPDLLAVVREVPDLFLGVAKTVMLFRSPGRNGLRSGTVIGPGPGPVDAADIDLDGDIDLCMVRRNELAVLAQSEDGGFVERTTVSLPFIPYSLAVAGFDDHPAPDLCMSSWEGTYLLRGAGDGRFGEPESVSGIFGALTAADLDEDVRSDLVVEGTATLILRSTGAGSFTDSGLLDTGPGGVILRDFDDDGAIDLVSGGGYLYENDGSAGFSPRPRLGGNDRWYLSEAQAVAAGDIDGDGDLDVFLLDASRVSMHRNDGAWAFETLEWLNAPEHPGEIHAADIDGDGLADLIASGLRILLNLGEPQAYGRRVVFFAESSRGVALASMDLEDDGDRDLVVARHDGLLALEVNQGDGSFTTAGEVAMGAGDPVIAASDLDGDGDQDLATGSSSAPLLRVLWKDGDATFRPGTALPQEKLVSAVLVSDFDGHSGMDIAAGAFQGDEVTLFLHESGESFATGDPVRFSTPEVLLEALDADADGDVDLTVGRAAATGRGAVSFLLNDGRARFDAGGSFTLEGRPLAAAAQDLNGDGRADLVVAIEDSGGCTGFSCFLRGGTAVFLSTGDGKFREGKRSSSFYLSKEILTADMDQDGDVDLGFPQSWIRSADRILVGQSVEISLNDGAGTFSPGPSLLVGARPEAVVADDFDGDGLPDLATASSTSLSIAYSRGGAPSEDQDGDGAPDDCSGARFRRGDADASGAVDLTDPLHVLLHLYRGGPAPPCAKAADANDDGRVDLADPVSLLDHLFRGGPAPPPPHASCDLDRSPDALDCEAHAPCS